MNNKQPSVAILLPVFNCEKYIEECLDSLINQTYENFKIVILDDQSTDSTLDIIQRYVELYDHIELHQNPKNLGIIESRNQLFNLSNAKYFAFMDGDDISLPERIKAQVDYLEQHTQIQVLSCWYNRFGIFEDTVCTPISNDDITSALFLSNVICNPAVMVKSDFLRKHKLKCDPDFRGAADYKLWVDCSIKGQLACLPQVLFCYRTHDTQESQKNNQRQRNSHFAILERQFLRLGLTISGQQISSLIWPKECQKSELYILGKWLQNTSENPKITDKDLARKVFSFVDIRFKSCCKLYGFYGLTCYLRSRGLTNLIRGKNLGLNFVRDCFYIT